MRELLKSFVFGVVEGVTEWLPISSTGHLLLLEKLLPFRAAGDRFYEMYCVVIQLGAVLAVLVLYGKELMPVQAENGILRVRRGVISLWCKIAAACVPAGIIGILFDDVIYHRFFTYKTVANTLILYGFLFIITERRKKHAAPAMICAEDFSYRTAILIGIFQVLSLIPGTSRSGATILGGMLLGASRSAAAEFTFFMAVPVMAGASAVKLIKLGFAFSAREWGLLAAGFFSAFAVSLLTIRGLLRFVKSHSFAFFGWYRIALGIAVLLFFTVYK